MQNITILEQEPNINANCKTLAEVAFDLPITLSSNFNECFCYSIPPELKEEVKVGTVVNVPFGKRELKGYVVGIKNRESLQNNFKIKPIHYVVCKKEIWDERFIELTRWISNYYLTNLGTVLSASINSEILSRKKKLKQSPPSSFSHFPSLFSPLVLNDAQQNAFDAVLKSIKNNESTTFLLHGVTGSGKTEVYLNLIEEVLKQNKTVIYLVPEIYLVTQTYERLKNRFRPSFVMIWHSSVSKKQKILNFENIDSAKIILGARSAVLAPVKNIGLIIVDEAHDAAYKQSSQAPRYDAIKVGTKRAEIANCPVLIGTATPNITDYHASINKQTLLELPKRIENVPMPKVHIIDLKEEYSRTYKNIISNTLIRNIKKSLELNEQVILLLNKRGYSSQVFCRACGYVQFCKHCSVPLVYHKPFHLMICHHCGLRCGADIETLCPKCRAPHFKYFGFGTQQLEEEVKKIFKDSKIIRVDSDQLAKKDEYIRLWNEFASHKADILIGTQLVAKGLDLQNVTLVGVVLADMMFNFPDYVSYERAFQLLCQVAGRAGRHKKPGNVFIQTYNPENPIFKYIKEHDYKSFFEDQIKQRELFLYPPFSILVRLIFQSTDENACINYANGVLRELSAISDTGQNMDNKQTEFLGPAPCFYSKLRGKYRYHIICKIKNDAQKDLLFFNLFKILKKNAKVDLIIDVDSINLL